MFRRAVWWALAGIGVAVGAVTLAAFEIGRTSGSGTAQTMAFATLALSELALVFGMRAASTAAWRLAMNRWLAWSVIASAAVIAAVVYFPPTQEAFATVALGGWQVAVVTALSLVPVLLVEAVKAGRRHRGPGRPASQPVRTAHPRGLSA